MSHKESGTIHNLKEFLRDVKYRFFPSENEKREIQNRMNFYAGFIKPGNLCFDVGANVGNRVMPLLKLGARVVAVEPQQDCCKVLKRRFGKKIDIIPKGLGDADELKEFYISDSHTLSSFSREWIDSVKEGRFNQNHWDIIEKVEITTLDNLINQYGIPHFIKIDTEGYETSILRGLHHAVNYISFEYTVPEQTSKAIECIDIVRKNGHPVECNFSVGESMTWKLPKWKEPAEMMAFIQTDQFITTGFGDIYIRLKNKSH